ncbi:MAG: ABC transporter substrate-binding protein [Dehalococcoidia bacterium]
MQNYWDKVTKERLNRRRLLQAGGALSVGVGALALIGCGSSDSDGGNGGGGSSEAYTGQRTPSTGEAKPGGNYGSYFATIGSYNTVAFYHDGYNNTGITVYDRPITARLGTDEGYVLEAMESIEVGDPLRVVLKLKPGMVFQNKAPVNGRAVTAADIVATQEYVKTLPNAENSQFQRTFVDRWEAPDANTVIIHLSKPSAYLLSSTYLANPTAQPIIPKELLSSLDTTLPIGSGPFELADHTFGTRYSYKKFENYREAKTGKPYFATREIFALTDAVAQESSFRSEQIHEWLPAASAFGRLNSELDATKFGSVNYLSPGLITINGMTNVQLGGARPWNDIRVREAFYRVTNKAQWISLAYDSRGEVPTGIVAAALPSYQLSASETEKFFKQDVAAAKQLLSAANYDSSKEWEIVVSNTNASNATAAEVWQQQLSQIGVKVRITAMPNAQILPQKMAPGQFDFWVGQQPGGDTPARAMRNLHSNTNDQFSNVGLYDTALDAMIEKSEVTTDREENIKLVKQIQFDALNKYTTSINAVTQQLAFFYNKKVANLIVDPLTGQDYQYDAWFV